MCLTIIKCSGSRLEIDFSSSPYEEYFGGSLEGQGDEVEKEGVREEREEEEQKKDLVPAAEGLDNVTTIVEEASTSMHKQTGLAADLDAGSPTLPHTTPIRSEVISVLTVYQVYLVYSLEN